MRGPRPCRTRETARWRWLSGRACILRNGGVAYGSGQGRKGKIQGTKDDEEGRMSLAAMLYPRTGNPSARESRIRVPPTTAARTRWSGFRSVAAWRTGSRSSGSLRLTAPCSPWCDRYRTDSGGYVPASIVFEYDDCGRPCCEWRLDRNDGTNALPRDMVFNVLYEYDGDSLSACRTIAVSGLGVFTNELTQGRQKAAVPVRGQLP